MIDRTFYLYTDNLRSYQILKLLLFFICFLFLSLANEVRGGQHTIQITKGYNSEADIQKIKSETRHEAFTKAALEEALHILPTPISKTRQDVLLSFLSSQAKSFVLSYSEQDVIQNQGELKVIWHIDINDTALKDLLKQLGTYYTCKQIINYSLVETGLRTQDYKLLNVLETVSGVKRSENEYPIILLNREKGSSNIFWHGEIKIKDKECTYIENSLQKLWKRIWSHFFSLDSVKSSFVDSLYLYVQGWTTSTDIQNFSSRLAKWHKVLEDTKILMLEFNPAQIESWWKVETLDQNSLEQRLHDYLSPRGLEFKISKKYNE